MTVDVENYVGGVPVVVLATDGMKLYGLLCDTDGHLQVDVKSGGGIPDAATETTLAIIMGHQEYIRSFAHSLNTLFGYYDRYYEQGIVADSGPGTVVKTLGAVPGGEVWILQCVSARNDDRAARLIFEITDDDTVFRILDDTMIGTGQALVATGEWVLKQGDRVQINFVGTIQNDQIRWGAWGYKMKV